MTIRSRPLLALASVADVPLVETAFTELVDATYDGDRSVLESVEYTGRAVVALASDPTVLEKSGRTLLVGELARQYGFTDVDGRQPPPFAVA